MRFAALSRAQKVGWWMGGRELRSHLGKDTADREERKEGFLVAVDEGREGGRARGGRGSVERGYAD